METFIGLLCPESHGDGPYKYEKNVAFIASILVPFVVGAVLVLWFAVKSRARRKSQTKMTDSSSV